MPQHWLFGSTINAVFTVDGSIANKAASKTLPGVGQRSSTRAGSRVFHGQIEPCRGAAAYAVKMRTEEQAGLAQVVSQRKQRSVAVMCRFRRPVRGPTSALRQPTAMHPPLRLCRGQEVAQMRAWWEETPRSLGATVLSPQPLHDKKPPANAIAP